MQFKRADRVAGLLREEISKIIQFELTDPRLGFVTVTEVDLSDDLRNARVYCGILGDSARVQESLAALADAASFIRKEVAGRVRLRKAPAITFHLDETAANAARIETLLRKIHEGGTDLDDDKAGKGRP